MCLNQKHQYIDNFNAYYKSKFNSDNPTPFFWSVLGLGVDSDNQACTSYEFASDYSCSDQDSQTYANIPKFGETELLSSPNYDDQSNSLLNPSKEDQLTDYLMCFRDRLDGIKTTVVEQKNNPNLPTGKGYVRDVTQSKPLNERLPVDHPKRAAVNMLLRVHNAKRSLCFVIFQKKMYGYDNSLKNLEDQFNKLMKKAEKIINQEKNSDEDINSIKELEKEFHEIFIEELVKNNLAKGIDIKKIKM